MSMYSFIGRSLALAVTLTVTGTAFARRPPVLEQRQAATERVLSTCDGGSRSTSGYRDMLARVDSKIAPQPAVASVRLAAIPQRMGDHVVLLCAGGRVHGPGGYRDVDVRFNVEIPRPQIAKLTLSDASRRVCKR